MGWTNIKATWTAKSSRIGSFFHREVASFLLLCSILGGLNEYLAVIPPDFVPQWVKTMVVVSGIISFVGGKLTKEQPK